MTDRERTILAAVETVLGAGLVVGALLASRFIGLLPSAVLLTFGTGALAHAVGVGLGLLSIHDQGGDRH